MEFFEKLDFLMKLTSTTNSALAFNTNLDPSHISRLRRGQRNALKNTGTIQLMSSYFARNIKEEYQRKALFEAIKCKKQLTETSEITDHIANWLKEKKPDEITSVREFLNGFSNYNTGKKPMEKVQTEITEAHSPSDVSVLYGVEGKRLAAAAFLRSVVAENKPQTLLLFSDEATEWMTADRNFTAEWTSLMTQVLAKGNRIKIIHTVSRDLDEMLHAIRQWMPLYMSGLIEPFFYPRKRDGLFKRTIFISPGVAAVTSTSLGGSIEQAPNIFTKNDEVIRALSVEFEEFLKQCKPLLHIYTAKEKNAYFELLRKFEKEKNKALLKTESLSLLTMPESVVTKINRRLDKTDIDLIDIGKERIRIFRENIKENSISEFIQVFDPAKVKDGKIKVSFSEMLLGGAAHYTMDEYILHLENVLDLLKGNENYHVHLIPEETSEYMVFVKEEIGAIVAKTSAPPIVLVIKETNLVSAFWDFLNNMISEKEERHPDNDSSAKKLQAYIKKLKESQ